MLAWSILALFGVASASDGLRGHQVLQINGIEPATLELVGVNDLWSFDPISRRAIVNASPRDISLLQLMPELRVQVLDANLHETVSKEKQAREQRQALRLMSSQLPLDDFSDYLNYEDLVSWYKRLAEAYPRTVRFVESIGVTGEGRAIPAVHICQQDKSNLNGNQRIRRRKERKVVWMQALIHAREWISGATLQFLAYHLASAPSSSDLGNYEFVLLPVVNPDGYSYSWRENRLWRKNRRPLMDTFGIYGVDLNRNFPSHWEKGGKGASDIPFSDTYRGPSPASEPETRAIMAYVEKLGRRVKGSIDWHCFSQLILFPWGWTEEPHPRSTAYRRLGNRLKQAFKKVNGRDYKAVPSHELYVNTGSGIDWFAEQLKGIWSVGVELPPTGRSGENGFMLDPKQIRGVGEESWSALKAFVAFLSEEAQEVGREA